MTTHRFLLLLAFLLLSIPGSVAAEEDSNWFRGPFQLEDQFPLAIYHASFLPESPKPLGAGSYSIRSAFAWTNTHNRISNRINVDAEMRTLSLAARYGFSKRFEVGVSVPVVWLGGGVLDSFIENWHDMFSLPQGPRDDPGVENDDFALNVRNENGEISSMSDGGLALGDLNLSTKYLLSEGSNYTPALAVSAALRLPSGASQYGQDSLDVTLGAHASIGYGDFYLYSGIGYLYYSDTHREALQFTRHRAQGYLYLEYAISPHVSLIIGTSLASNLIDNVPEFPDYENYLDIGGKIGLGVGTELELLVRENPTPDTGTADYTMMLAIHANGSVFESKN